MAGGRDLECNLVDLTGISLRELAELDDQVLEEALDRLLQACGGGANRLWSLNISGELTV
jgi:FXSXX-COOH protein